MGDDRDIPRVRPLYDDDYGYEGKDLGEDAGMRMLLPVGRSVWAIVSGYLGLISVLLVPAPFAVLTGILAILEMRRNPKKHGMGRAIFGIVMGVIGSGVLVAAVVAALITKGHRGW